MSKAIRLSVLAPLALAWLCGSALAQGGVTNSTKNPQQIAILHWYEANLTTSFAMGKSATGVAFDGANIWVTDRRAQPETVSKLRASDGALLATFTARDTNVGNILCDGTNLWMTGNNFVSKVRASDFAVLAQIPPPANFPGAGASLAFDGANIWESVNSSPCPSSGCVGALMKVRANDGVVLGLFPVGPVATGVIFDGVNIWVIADPIKKVRPSDGAVVGTVTENPKTTPDTLVSDGTNLWVYNFFPSTSLMFPGTSVTKVRISDGTVLGTFRTGDTPFLGGDALVFDGANIWGINQRSLFKLRASDGTLLFGLPINGPGGPVGLVFDGANVWVADGSILRKM